MHDRKYLVLVAIQQALLGEISLFLRAILVSFDNFSIHFDCYFDGKISEEDIESMSCVETELIAQFPETHKISHQVHRLDYPNAIPKEKIWAYYRKEN